MTSFGIPSSLGFGTLHLGSSLDRPASKELILHAIEQGITFFDTAPLYGNGYSEEILGDALSETRQEIFISTKVGLQISKRADGIFGVEIAKLNANTLKKSVEKSLQNLRRESIDLLMLHAFDPHTNLDETIQALYNLYKEGKIKNIGCSNYNPEQLKKLLKHNLNDLPFIAAQCHYNMIERRAGQIFIPFCKKKGISVIVNRALARGALSGQYKPGQLFDTDSRAAKSPRIQKWLTEKKLMLLETLTSIAKEHGTSLEKISLKWLLRNHSQMVVLLGVRNKSQLEECLKISSSRLDDAIFDKIETALKNEQTIYRLPPRYFEK